MANELDHIALANKNHEVLIYLMEQPGKYPEWIATVAFYKAVQIVEATFSNHHSAKNCSSHPDRLAALKHPDFQLLFPHYRALYSASTVARYLHDNLSHTSYSKFSDYLPSEKVVSKLVYGRLRPVEENAIKLLSDDAKKELKRLDSQKPRT